MAQIELLQPTEKIKDSYGKINDAISSLNSATSAATPNTIVQRDANGRFKAAAPAAADDVARKAEVDATISGKEIPGNDANHAIKTGYYHFNPSTLNGPGFQYGIIHTMVSNGDTYDGTNNWVFQAAYTTGYNAIKMRRKINDGPWSDWSWVWTSESDGAGSGLDADLLDGKQPSTSASANTIVQRDGSGQFEVGAPTASNHVARKAEVDGKVSKSGDTMTGDLSMGYTENGERRLVWETPGSNVYWYYHHSSSRNDFGIYDSGLLQSPFVYDRLTSIVKLFNNFEIYNDGSVLNRFYVGVGSPEGNITAPPGAIYQDKGSPGGLYIKDTGTGNMGWKKVQTA